MMASQDDENVSPQSFGGIARAEKLSSEDKTAIAVKAAAARWQKPRTLKQSSGNNLGILIPQNPRTPIQLDLFIEKQVEIDGILMGVLSDGTPFLSGRGLARLCGVDSTYISKMSISWNGENASGMAAKVKEILASRGVSVEKPYIEITQRSGAFHAYPDVVCLAVLEYYAFDAPKLKDEAKKNFRLLAGKALAEFIFTQVGYDPTHSVPDEWKQFHDRVSLTYNSVPRGYFGIFKEMADMVVTLGQAGLHIDSKFVPDISVGQCWAKHWNDNGFDSIHGTRIKFDHNYPDYFPQAKSNPQDAWCYPDAALGEFRRWLRDEYIGAGRLKKYITDKVKAKELPPSFSQIAIQAYGGKE